MEKEGHYVCLVSLCPLSLVLSPPQFLPLLASQCFRCLSLRQLDTHLFKAAPSLQTHCSHSVFLPTAPNEHGCIKCSQHFKSLFVPPSLDLSPT